MAKLEKVMQLHTSGSATSKAGPTATVLPITVLLAARNEEANIGRCLASLHPATRVIVLDSRSCDRTAEIAHSAGAEVEQFDYRGGYPKKRQWAIDTLPIATEWILLLDADEVVPVELWAEIAAAIQQPAAPNGFVITKGFHFLGRRFRFGGFSFGAVLLVRRGKARFERILDDTPDAMDMEVHERVIVEGPLGRLRCPLIHEDFKGLAAYIDRHNKYSTWESRVRHEFLTTGRWGEDSIHPRLLGNTQERRRFFKYLALRTPGEPLWWFLYHWVFRLGFLEGRPGLIACRIRSDYIAAVRAKLFELRRQEKSS